MDSSGETGRAGWSYRSDGRNEGGGQGAAQIDHGHLNTGMTVGTGYGIRLILVMVEQAAEEYEKEYGNNC
jgi:chromosome condensin MukBEF ATPase and DNA-binding subunit MukB